MTTGSGLSEALPPNTHSTIAAAGTASHGPIQFWLNDRAVTVSSLSPNTTLLQFLRHHAHLAGTKEGCAEGDCGACTVIMRDHNAADQRPCFRAINACILLLPMVHGRHIYTVEGIQSQNHDTLHIAQQAMVEHLGSQCGYCTPGVVMAMFEACYRHDLDEAWKLDDQMCGNLCRCTGYRPIRAALHAVAGKRPDDRFRAQLSATETEAPSSATHTTVYTPQHGAPPQPEHRFVTPTSLDALLDYLHAHPDALPICGGTDLALTITKHDGVLPHLVSVERIPELRAVASSPTQLTLGAALPLTDVEAISRTHAPMVERMLRFFGARQIKHRATLGGNVCNASPIGDLAPVLLALKATCVLASRQRGVRTVPIDDFFLGYRKTALQPGEILMQVIIPALPHDARGGVYKVSRRRELDISGVAAACVVRLETQQPSSHSADLNGSHPRTSDPHPVPTVIEARFAFGGMAATPIRARQTEAAVLHQPWNEHTVHHAMQILATELTPIGDHRASAWYRCTVAQNLLLGFYHETLHQPFVRLPDRPTACVVLP